MAGLAGLLGKGDIQAINRSVERAVSLPSALYTTPESLALERERIYFAGWTCVAVGGQVPEPGDILPVSVAGAPILVVRDRERRLKAYHNVCRHRGTQLVTEFTRKQRVLVCPYHGWSYGLDGALRETPHFEGLNKHEPTAFKKSEMGLKEVRLEMWRDLVFVNVSGTAPPLAEQFAEIDSRWAPYDFSALRYGTTTQFDLKANWKLCMENFLESYHLPFAHPRLNASSRMELHGCMITPDYFGQYSDDYRGGDAGHSSLAPFPGLPKSLMTRAEYPTFLPNLMLGLHPDYFFIFTLEPEAPDRTKETFHFYFVGEAATSPEYEAGRKGAIDLWVHTNREDMGVVERMQVGRHSPGYVGARFSPHHEPTTHEFQRRVARLLAGRGAARKTKVSRAKRARRR